MTMALPVRRRSSEFRRSDPFLELDELQRRFSSLLESTFGDLSGSSFGGWTPPVDIEETDDSFVVEAELPGVKQDDVSVELSDDQLVIHGEVKERERTGVLRRQTRHRGRFDYRVALPGQVEADKVDASLRDGVLRLELPKSESAKPRRIPIASS